MQMETEISHNLALRGEKPEDSLGEQIEPGIVANIGDHVEEEHNNGNNDYGGAKQHEVGDLPHQDVKPTARVSCRGLEPLGDFLKGQRAGTRNLSRRTAEKKVKPVSTSSVRQMSRL